jgi:hypothetical protein
MALGVKELFVDDLGHFSVEVRTSHTELHSLFII